jgi:hypothetical protein
MRSKIFISLLSIIFIIILIIPIQKKNIKFGEYWRHADIIEKQKDIFLEFEYPRNREIINGEQPVYPFLNTELPNDKAIPKKIKKRVRFFRRTRPIVFVSSANPRH